MVTPRDPQGLHVHYTDWRATCYLVATLFLLILSVVTQVLHNN